ncbi:hypothetical protein EBX93_01985, partial [bacterium]|nr:hypothetical protein [bacterium]
MLSQSCRKIGRMGEQRKIDPTELDQICEELLKLDQYDREKRMMEYAEELTKESLSTLKRAFKAYKKQNE